MADLDVYAGRLSKWKKANENDAKKGGGDTSEAHSVSPGQGIAGPMGQKTQNAASVRTNARPRRKGYATGAPV